MGRKVAYHLPETRRRFKPTLELLEQRLVLANCVWTGAFGNNSWFNSFNWANLTVPGAADTAAFTQAAPNCTLSGASTTVGCLIIQGWGGTLTIGDGSTLSVSQTSTSGPSDIADSTITGTGSASLIFTSGAAVSLLGGTINPPTTQFAGATSVLGAATVALGGAVSNTGTFTIQSGQIQLQPGCVFTNNSNFVMNSPGTDVASTGGGGQQFLNATGAVYNKSGGSATIAVAFVNTGFVDVQTGTLNFTASAVQLAGTINVETGAVLSTTSNIELDGGALATGTSQVSGNLNVVSAVVYPGALDPVPFGTLNVSGSYICGANSALGMSILLNSSGTVKQYTSLNAAVVACGGALLVSTSPFGVTPRRTDLANLITSPAISGDFGVGGGIPGTSPMLKWVHNTVNPPANTYQVKIAVAGPVPGTTAATTIGSTTASKDQSASQWNMENFLDKMVKDWPPLDTPAIDALMSKQTLTPLVKLELLMAWSKAEGSPSEWSSGLLPFDW
jgi:hypothetical protein